MRIGIDARLYGLEHAGLGRYVYSLVQEILKADKKDHFVLFVRSKYLHEFDNFSNVSVVKTDIPIYGFREQLVLPFIFASQKLDFLHVPHFNAPLLYPGKLILTIHDLIKHYSKGKETTTRNPWAYNIKRLGYKILTKLIAQKAANIICPTEFVRQDITKTLGIDPGKITVTYEAVSSNLKKVELNAEEKKQLLKQYDLTQPFFVYTGSVYPHKNVELLIEAIAKHNSVMETDLNLAIICSRSVFYERLHSYIQSHGYGSFIKMLGFLPDEEVSKIYSLCLGLIHPSKMEGFGLTGLEAMKLGVPVISARSSCLPEVYGDAAIYFNPDSVDELVEIIADFIKNKELREKLSTLGPVQSKRYSWSKMAKDTLKIYKRFKTV